jgi:hypothetical protein
MKEFLKLKEMLKTSINVTRCSNNDKMNMANTYNGINRMMVTMKLHLYSFGMCDSVECKQA